MPIVPRQVFAQYMDELSTMRYEALRLNRILKDTNEKLAQVRCILAPNGAALTGIGKRLNLDPAEVQHQFVTAIFEQPDADESLVKQFGLASILSVRCPRMYRGDTTGV